jgi:hypothetical protein
VYSCIILKGAAHTVAMRGQWRKQWRLEWSGAQAKFVHRAWRAQEECTATKGRREHTIWTMLRSPSPSKFEWRAIFILMRNGGISTHGFLTGSRCCRFASRSNVLGRFDRCYTTSLYKYVDIRFYFSS